MGSFLHLFETTSLFNQAYSFGGDGIYKEPWVSCTEEGGGVITYSKPYAMMYYNVEDISEPTSILNKTNGVESMIIDGIIQSPATTYQFSSTGKKCIKFIFSDPTKIPNTAFCFLQTIDELFISRGIVETSGIDGRDSGFVRESSLKKIHIPVTMRYFGTNSFYSCNQLQKVYVRSVKDFTKITFASDEFVISYANPLAFAHHLYLENEEEVTEYFFPGDTHSIGRYVFHGASNINITIPSGISEVGKGAFYGCSRMTTPVNLDVEILKKGVFQNASISFLALPNIISISNEAVYSNSNISYIDLGPNLAELGDRALFYLPNLKTLIVRATTPPTYNLYSLYRFHNDVVIYVPYSQDHSVLAAYQAASGWSEWASKMQELNPDGTI
jgi:hypothetical protein